MSYVAIYRRYRPTTFSEMVGQDHITNILKSQVESGKIAHAYIFSGIRGTGKTSAAKIFAKSINCLNVNKGEPCNKCEACISIANGSTNDFVEMDAASNNSVENIRSIRQEVIYATNSLKYKVYIIDEVHMLSTSASNALLKTLEEPPKNVIFILATTEEHKILPTILSRCVRFEFKKVSIENIVKRLKEVLEDLNIEYEHEALEEIAKLADGGVRDSLSILERCINLKKKITKQRLQEIVGIKEESLLNALVDGIINKEVKNVSIVIDKMLETGNNLRYITSNILEMFLEVLINKASDDEKNKKNITIERLNYIIKQLAKLDEDIRQSVNTNILFKAKILEITTEETCLDEATLIARIKELENKIQSIESTKPSKTVKIVEKEEEKFPEFTEKIKKDENKMERLKEISCLDKVLKSALESDYLKLYSALMESKAYEDENKMIIRTDNSFAYSILEKEEVKEELKKILKEVLKKEYIIRIELIESKKIEKKNKFEEMLLESSMPFEVVD